MSRLFSREMLAESWSNFRISGSGVVSLRHPTGACGTMASTGRSELKKSLVSTSTDSSGVFEEVRRVLRDDGTLWLNIGDSYTSGNRDYRAPDKKNPVRAMSYRAKTPHGLKPKDLIGVPWRLALALQKDGWYLRSDIIWEKPNCMPESVKDRPTRSHEYMFLLSKSLVYHYDAANVREANGRNRRTVWSVPTEPFAGAHFATFPPKLIEPCILAGTGLGDWVLDPFFGSGTVGVVCEQQNRNYVGIELNPEYVELAVQRIQATERLLFTDDRDAEL